MSSDHPCSVVDPLVVAEWDARMADSAQTGFFHSRMWAHTLSRSYRYRPLYLLRGSPAAMEALVPLMEVRSSLTGCRGVGLPFSDYAPPLASTQAALSDLVRQAIDLGLQRNWRYAELRGVNPSLAGADTASAWFYGHRVSLSPGEDELFKRLDSTTRTGVRKARRGGLEVRFSTDWQDLRAFCRFNDLTRRRHGLPPQPLRFFRNLQDAVMAAGRGMVAVASRQGRDLAAAVFFTWNRTAYYKYGASALRGQEFRPNNLIMWEALRKLSAEGFASLCLGRTEVENEGLRRFKLGWGAEEYRIEYVRYDFQAGSFVQQGPPIHGFHNRVFRRLPLPALKLLGRVLYRHLG